MESHAPPDFAIFKKTGLRVTLLLGSRSQEPGSSLLQSTDAACATRNCQPRFAVSRFANKRESVTQLFAEENPRSTRVDRRNAPASVLNYCQPVGLLSTLILPRFATELCFAGRNFAAFRIMYIVSCVTLSAVDTASTYLSEVWRSMPLAQSTGR